jgi:hypothetical protein
VGRRPLLRELAFDHDRLTPGSAPARTHHPAAVAVRCGQVPTPASVGNLDCPSGLPLLRSA